MQKISAFLLLFGLSVSVSVAQSRLLKKGSVPKDIYIEVPFEVFQRHMIILAEVNGVTQRFLFDTGAPNLIRAEFLSGDTKVKSLKVQDSQRESGKKRIGTVDRITIGGVEFSDYAAIAHDFTTQFPFSCYQIAGFIGSNLLRDLIVKIDWQARQLIITDDLKKVNPRSNPISMKLSGAQQAPYIPFHFSADGKSELMVLFDSGYNGFLALQKGAYEKIARRQDLFKNVLELMGFGSVGLYGTVNSRQYAATIKHLGIGEAVLQNLNTTTSNGDSKIGLELLQYGNVILDFKEKDFYFESIGPVQDLSADMPPYLPTVRDNTFVIGYILRDDLKARIKSGDKIISIDGVNLRDLAPCDMLKISPRPKERFQVLSADGEVVDVVL